jgi:ATP-binding cassette subfamily B protein
VYQRPPVLIFDEPPAPSTPSPERAVKENLDQLLTGRTSFPSSPTA